MSDAPDESMRVRVALELIAAMSNNDSDAMRRILSEDVRWWIPISAAEKLGVESPRIGHESAVSMVAGGHRRYEKFVYSPQSTLTNGLEVAVFAGLDATPRNGGEQYENSYAFRLRFEGNQVVELWEFTDTAHLFARLNV